MSTAGAGAAAGAGGPGPEPGGELFLPRKGIDRERGRAVLAIAASWYGAARPRQG